MDLGVQVAVADVVERGHVADLAGVDQHVQDLDGGAGVADPDVPGRRGVTVGGAGQLDPRRPRLADGGGVATLRVLASCGTSRKRAVWYWTATLPRPVRHGDPAGAAHADIGQSRASTRRKSSSLTRKMFHMAFRPSGRMQQPMKRRMPWMADAGPAVSQASTYETVCRHRPRREAASRRQCRLRTSTVDLGGLLSDGTSRVRPGSRAGTWIARMAVSSWTCPPVNAMTVSSRAAAASCFLPGVCHRGTGRVRWA